MLCMSARFSLGSGKSNRICRAPCQHGETPEFEANKRYSTWYTDPPCRPTLKSMMEKWEGSTKTTTDSCVFERGATTTEQIALEALKL